MKRQMIRRLFTGILCCGIAGIFFGCLPMEQRKQFETDYRDVISSEEPFPVDLPETLRPRLNQLPEQPQKKETGPFAMSVEQAVMAALENNADLRVRLLTPMFNGTFEKIERGVYDPEIFAELAHGRSFEKNTTFATGQSYWLRGRDVSAQAGVRQKLPTGTTLEAEISYERGISNRAAEKQIARMGVSVTQSLLRGFGAAVNLASVEEARLDTQASIYELRGYVEALTAETETAYWQLVLAEQKLAIHKSSLAVARQGRDEIVKRIEVGLLPETEGAAVRAEVARNEQALIDAESQMKKRQLQLVRLVNPNPEGRFDPSIEAVSEPQISPEPINDLSDRLLLADRMRPDLNEAMLRLDKRTLEIIRTRNGLLPKLDFFAVLGKSGYADLFPDVWEHLDDNGYDFSAGIRLSHYLNNRAAEARNTAARISRNQAETALANLRQLALLDVRLAVNEAERARRQISASAETRKYLEQTLTAEKQRFDVGMSTALLVAQAHRDLLAGRIAEVESIVNYRLALVALYLSEGSLLERRGIALPASEK